MYNYFLVFSYCITVFFASAQQEAAPIRLNLTIGNEYYQVIKNESSVNQLMKGQELVMKTIYTSSLVYIPTVYQNGVYDMDVYYNDMSMYMDDGTTLIQSQTIENYIPVAVKIDELDQKELANELYSVIFSSILNKKFHIKMSEYGEIIAVSGYSDIYNGLATILSELPEDTRNNLINEMLSKYGEEQLKALMSNGRHIYSKKPVKVKDKWSAEYQDNSGYSKKVKVSYELDFVNNKSYMIKCTGSTATPSKGSKTLFSGITYNYFLKGVITGTVNLDKESGWPVLVENTTLQEGYYNVLNSDYFRPKEKIQLSSVTKNTISKNRQKN